MQLAEVAMQLIRREQFTHMVTIANFETEGLRSSFAADPDLTVIAACREGEGVAIASGLAAAGRKVVLCIENVGFFECLDTLRALPCDMSIPLPIFVGYLGRGATYDAVRPFAGGMAGHVSLAGTWTEAVLDAASIKHTTLLPDADEADARTTLEDALAADEPFVVLVDQI